MPPSFSANIRAVMSVLPPAAKGTTIVIGRAGQVCACANPHVPRTSVETERTALIIVERIMVISFL
jgi:hypothetical protein